MGLVVGFEFSRSLKGENHRDSGIGAGTRDRTGDTSLEGWGFTAKLCPLAVVGTLYGLGYEGQGDSPVAPGLNARASRRVGTFACMLCPAGRSTVCSRGLVRKTYNLK